MAWQDEAERRETQRRIDAAIDRASACLMNDTKWRELLGVLRDLNVGRLGWKFVNDARVFQDWVPAPYGVLERSFGDVTPYPYGPYREIEWVEIPSEHASRVIAALAGIGQFPAIGVDGGVRIVGYAW